MACPSRAAPPLPSRPLASLPPPLPTTVPPTTYYLLPTIYLLPTTYYPLPTTYYLLPTTYYLLPTTYYLLLSMRFIPLASNHLGRRGGWHFEALLFKLSFHIVHKPSGCRLMQGTFAMLSADHQAAADIRRCWGARLTWTTQRAHAMRWVSY